MKPSARVFSVEALESFHASLARFGARAEDVLATAARTINAALDELSERFRYWTREIRERTEEVARLRSALSFARMGQEGKAAGTSELELDLRKAIRKQREAEEKLEAVRRWRQALPDAVREFDGPARKLSGFLESDLKQALAFLRERMAALEGYLAVPLGPMPDAPESTAEPKGPEEAKA